jgi:hypothetical protein
MAASPPALATALEVVPGAVWERRATNEVIVG